MSTPRARIHRLLLAELTLPPGSLYADAPYLVHAFAIEHQGGAILVDSGLGVGNASIDRIYPGPRHALVDALAGCGLRLADIVAIVNTHLHFDHCGGNSLLPGVPIYAQAREIEAARAPHYTVPEWLDFEGANWKPLDAEHELAAGVRLVPTPGHTPGHQSVLVESAGRRALICGQAVYCAAEFDAGANVAEAHEGFAEQYRVSFARLRELAADEVFFSHDPRSWRPAGE